MPTSTTEISDRTPTTRGTPPADQVARTMPLKRGPTKVPMASTAPVAALPVVRSPVVREMRGSRALCAGRVMVMATAATAARTATTATGAVDEHGHAEGDRGHCLRGVPQPEGRGAGQPADPRGGRSREQRRRDELDERDRAGAAHAAAVVGPHEQGDPGRPLAHVEDEERDQDLAQVAVGHRLTDDARLRESHRVPPFRASRAPDRRSGSGSLGARRGPVDRPRDQFEPPPWLEDEPVRPGGRPLGSGATRSLGSLCPQIAVGPWNRRRRAA